MTGPGREPGDGPDLSPGTGPDALADADSAPDPTDQTFQLLRPDTGAGTGTGGTGSRSTARRPPLGREVTAVFAVGEVVAGRFRVTRFLAQGGMGQVYAAADLELHEEVALKTVRGEIAGDERALHRFKREIHLARRVTHPNVCRTYDLFRHAGEPGAPPTFVLAMELLAGETLAERLKRGGPFSPEEALPIVRQMAEALAAAHRAGVVHRDFNPKNVMLAPGPEGTRAVVTDFGLAHAAAEDRLGAQVTALGVAAGTPAYMAPEQVEGREAGPAADLYAFGVVLYEMVTGRWPFVGDSPLATAAKRLREPPPSPRVHAPHLPERWEAVILRCLARAPEERFASVLDAARALEEPAPGAISQPRRPTAILAAAVIALLLVVALVPLSFRLLSPRPASQGPTAPAAIAAMAQARPAVAVLGFKNLSGRPDAAWMSVAFAEMLGTELAAGRGLRTVPGETVARAKTELALPETQTLGKESLARLRGLLGADYVVLGSYSALGPAGGAQLRLDVHLQDAGSGETVAALAETGSEARLFDMVTRAGARLRERLGVAEPSAGERRQVQAALPEVPEAARLYAQGLARRRSYDHQAARDLFARAVAAQPDFPLAHAALAGAWAELGYDARARSAAQRAFDLSKGLPREERLLIEGQLRGISRDWPRAIDAYGALFRVFPDNSEYGLRLAAAQISAGTPAAAFMTLKDVRELAAPERGERGGEDPRIDLMEARAAGAVSDHARQERAATRALLGARRRGARLLAAEARAALGSAWRNLGSPERALAAFAEAAAALREVGDRAGVARQLRNQALARSDLGDLTAAERLYREALAVQLDVGNRGEAAAVLNNLAIVRRRRGDLAGAARLHREALAAFHELDSRDNVSRTENSLANVLAEQGDLAGARQAYERSLAVKREVGDRGGVAAALSNIADLEVVEGRLGEARRLREEALAVDRETGNLANVASDSTGLGEILYLQGGLQAAEGRHREALALARRVGDRSLEAWARYGLAQVRLARGDLAAARDEARRALELWSRVGERDEAARARLALARIALAEGDPGLARREAEAAAEQLAAAGQPAEAAAARCLLAEAWLAAGDRAAARREVAAAADLGKAAQPLATRLRIALVGARADVVGGAGDPGVSGQGVRVDTPDAGDRARADAPGDPARAEEKPAAGDPGDPKAARAALEDVRRRAEAAGLVELALEARLALGALDLAERRAGARERLRDLASEAERRGFGLLARRAAAVLPV